MSKINLFISYSHADKSYFENLKKYINSKNCPNINVWDDGEIDAGTEWDQQIKKKLEDAHMILLLISQDFLNSHYIDQVELKAALEKHEQKKCRVIPIFTKTCYLNNHPQITRLQGLPAGMKFLSDLGEQVYAQYTEIQREIIEIATEMLTEMNIRDSIAQEDDNSRAAKAIGQLSNTGKIFLSVPASEEAKKKRRALLMQVEGKIKYENWPYEIVPSIPDTEALYKKSPDELVAACKEYIEGTVYSIHIIASETDLVQGPDKIQYDLSKQLHAESAFHKRIVWLLQADIKAKLDKEVSMDPLFTGNDFEFLFDLIKNLDAEKNKKINALKTAFSPNKKVFMFYDFSKDHNSELRIQLKTKIEENENIAVLLNMPNGTLSADREELEKCDGACIFYGASDPEWFLMRQSILIASGKTGSKAICIDEPEIDVKIKRDVSKNAFITIRGKNDFEDGVKHFLDKLKFSV